MSSSSTSDDRPARKRIFGTDGVRGVANVEPVTAETALKLGRAAAHVIAQSGRGHGRANPRPTVALGKDTRQSGYMLEDALAAGLMSLGVDVLQLGPLPTPGVAYITRSLRCDAGIVLTASHNSYEDNGIKFFRHDGYKLDDDIERQIEDLVFSGEIENIRPTAGKIGRAQRIDDALGRYVEFAKTSFPRKLTLDKLRIAVDVANGAGYKSTPCILRELGADVLTFHNTPDGTNINRDCGSTFPQEIQLLVRQTGAQIGITHDGDADRVLLCDEKGELVDGDEVMAIAAREFLRQGRLAQNTLAATVMSNYGLDAAVEEAGGRVVRTQVGDRYVIEEMVKAGPQRRRRAERTHDLPRLHDDRRRDHHGAANLAHHDGDGQTAERTQAVPVQVPAGPAQLEGRAQDPAGRTDPGQPARARDRESPRRERPGPAALLGHGTEGAPAHRGT